MWGGGERKREREREEDGSKEKGEKERGLCCVCLVSSYPTPLHTPERGLCGVCTIEVYIPTLSCVTIHRTDVRFLPVVDHTEMVVLYLQ